VKVYVPGLLTSYTGGANTVESIASTLGEMLADLDARYPGIRFRIIDEQDRVRTHIRIFVGATQVHAMSAPIAGDDKVMIVGALSGG
jgi:molybdopterin converting factor small subunit